jgi:hypothetical protein
MLCQSCPLLLYTLWIQQLASACMPVPLAVPAVQLAPAQCLAGIVPANSPHWNHSPAWQGSPYFCRRPHLNPGLLLLA